MKVIRYSDAFKMQVVREVEAGEHTAFGARRKYNIKGAATVTRWVRQLGSGKYGKIIRVERPEEINEGARLRTQLRQAKEALADAHMELALEKAFLGVACEQLDQTVEGFKKTRWQATHQAVEFDPELSVVALCDLAQMPMATLALSVCCTIQSASAAMQVSVPGEVPGIPACALFGYDPVIGDLFILHDEKWTAIPFYRGPDCVPPDFNLIDFADFTPDPDYGLRVFGCPLTVTGFEVWPVYDPATTPPVSTVLMGPVQPYPFVAVYLVNNDELLAAMADGLLTIGELEALPSLRIGHATFFQEINGSGHLTEDGQYTSLHYELTASGTLAEDASKTFSVHFTTGGRFEKGAKAYPNLVQAEVRFGN